MYGIQSASELTGVAKDMIRHYEKLGLISPGRGENNYRVFSENNLLRLVLIKYLNNLGIELKELRRMFQTDDLAAIVAHLRSETQRLDQLQKHIEAKAAATRMSLHCFEHYVQGETSSIVYVKRRFLYSRDKHSNEDYCRLCQRFAQTECFYQYYYLQQMTLKNGQAQLGGHDVGVLVYDPLPFFLPGAIELKPQRYYQATVRVSKGEYMAEEELRPHIQAAGCPKNGQISILTYQLFELDREQNKGIVCIEIPLGE